MTSLTPLGFEPHTSHTKDSASLPAMAAPSQLFAFDTKNWLIKSYSRKLLYQTQQSFTYTQHSALIPIRLISYICLHDIRDNMHIMEFLSC